jgi:hypothetical protein
MAICAAAVFERTACFDDSGAWLCGDNVGDVPLSIQMEDVS